MIELHRLNDKDMIINADLIEIVEQTPDTVITMNNGNKYVVKETVQEVVDKVVDYKKSIFAFGRKS